MSDHDGLIEDVLGQVKALEAAGRSELAEAEQRTRVHIERAVSRISDLEAKVARVAELEAKVARLHEVEARLAKLVELEARTAKFGEIQQKMAFLADAMRHLKFVVEPLLQNWDNFFASAPPQQMVTISSFRSALTALQTDINHLVSS